MKSKNIVWVRIPYTVYGIHTVHIASIGVFCTNILILEHDFIIRDMETIKVEWEKRARAAEKNLVSLLKETDESQATAKRLKKELKVLRHKNQADELEFLTRIKTQQGA